MSASNFALGLYLSVSTGFIVEVPDVQAFASANQTITPAESSDIPETVSVAPSTKQEEHAELVNRVHRHVNEFRREHGLRPLTLDPTISAQAREHSADLARNGSAVSHRGFHQRLQDIQKAIPYRAAAENVAVNVGYENPAEAAVEGWKNSPEHQKNMLGDFSLTGIGVAQSKDGSYFFTQIFLEPIK